MKALIFADLHFDNWWNPEKQGIYFSTQDKKDYIKYIKEKADCVLLCGDNATLIYNFENHRQLFRLLKKKFKCPIGFVLGNHELWRSQTYYGKIIYNYFNKLAEEEGVAYLENKNLKIKDWIIAGTYGHYDYSLGKTEDGITKKNFENGVAEIEGRLIRWLDKKFINLGDKTDEQICFQILDKFEKRIPKNTDKIITISHTLPNMDVCGHKKSKKQNFLGAFSGTKRLEKILENYPIKYHFCGHTHAKAQTKINSTQVFNVGSDYEDIKYILLDTEKNDVKYFP